MNILEEKPGGGSCPAIYLLHRRGNCNSSRRRSMIFHIWGIVSAYAEQGKDNEKNQDNTDSGNNWIVPGHKTEKRRRLAAPGVCGLFGGKMADSIPPNGDKSTNEQDNSHNNFHLLVSRQEFLYVIITEGENPCKPKIKYIGGCH